MWDIDVDVAPGDPNPETGRNEGGIIVYLVRGETEYVEFCRVRFIRRESQNPKKGFKTTLRAKLEDVVAAKNALNQVDIDIEEAQERLDDLMSRADALREEYFKQANQGDV